MIKNLKYLINKAIDPVVLLPYFMMQAKCYLVLISLATGRLKLTNNIKVITLCTLENNKPIKTVKRSKKTLCFYT